MKNYVNERIDKLSQEIRCEVLRKMLLESDLRKMKSLERKIDLDIMEWTDMRNEIGENISACNVLLNSETYNAMARLGLVNEDIQAKLSAYTDDINWLNQTISDLQLRKLVLGSEITALSVLIDKLDSEIDAANKAVFDDAVIYQLEVKNRARENRRESIKAKKKASKNSQYLQARKEKEELEAIAKTINKNHIGKKLTKKGHRLLKKRLLKQYKNSSNKKDINNEKTVCQKQYAA